MCEIQFDGNFNLTHGSAVVAERMRWVRAKMATATTTTTTMTMMMMMMMMMMMQLEVDRIEASWFVFQSW